MERTGRLDRGDGIEVAWAYCTGHSPTVVFLPGFGADMDAEKPMVVLAAAVESGHATLRFDYSGHGRSGGDIMAGTIGRWVDEARAVIDHVAGAGPLLLVGSSMGGWISLLLAREMPERVAGLIGIAAAPDFTERLWEAATPAAREAAAHQGYLELPNPLGEPYRLGRALLDEGRAHLLLGGSPIRFDGPVRLLQGFLDTGLPWQVALSVAELVTSTDIRVTIVKDGEHRLSRTQDLRLIGNTVRELLR